MGHIKTSLVKLVLCDNLERWDGVGGGREVQQEGSAGREHMYTYDWFMLMYGWQKPTQ